MMPLAAFPYLGYATEQVPGAGSPLASEQPADSPESARAASFPANCRLPRWPYRSLVAGESGTVTVDFALHPDGTVADVNVLRSSGYPDLDNATVRAVAKCKYPARSRQAALAKPRLGIHFVYTIEEKRGSSTALRASAGYRAWADKQSVESQFGIARVFRTGHGRPRDDAQAAEWYARAAQRGHVLAQYNLGLMHLAGEGVDKSEAEAAAWMRKAAAQGHAAAQFNLAVFHMRGQGVAKSASEAELWMRKAAEQGLATAQVQLGDMYDQGRGVPADGVLSAAWYRKAAEQGDVTGQFYLAQCYEFGVGVAQDLEAARTWYAKAAGQGHREAAAAMRRIDSR